MADDLDRPRTPSPPTRVHTPPAPRMGFLDSWDPYATPAPRKSTRISSQRAAKRSASPNPNTHQQSSVHSTSEGACQFPASSGISPQPPSPKKRQPAPDSVRRAVRPSKGSDDIHPETDSAMKGKTARRSTVSRTKDMLLTPSKTPRKVDTEKQVSSLGHVARELFSTGTEDLTPRKRQKKYTGISLESFTAEEIEEPFDIFTDSRDRVPSKDESEENPFYGEVAVPEPPAKRRSKRSVKIPGEGTQTVDAATRREDGMLYVFRGKKFFRKFTEDDPEEMDELQQDSEVEEELETRLARPLRRSAIKPKLLFQTEKTPAMIEEEEAPTDVEDIHEDEDEEERPQTPVKSHHRAQTPEAPKFAPVSPPDTKRTTRSMNKLLDEGTPMKKPNVRRITSFDSWRRTKDPRASSSGTKRAGESLASSTTKRTRT